MHKKLLLSLSIAFVSITQLLLPVNIIFDLHNVLITTNKRSALARLPKKDLVLYCVLFRQSPQASLYKILHKIKPIGETTGFNWPMDDHSNPLPQLMVDWLNGSINPEDIIEVVTQECNQHPEWFEYLCEKRIILALAHLLFSPDHFSELQNLHPHATQLVKKCKAAGHNVYVLSNWDQQSFAILRQKHADFFNLFDGIGISGTMQSAKPAPIIYKKLLDAHQLNPNECWFIDDQPVNLLGAQEAGLNTILCTSKKSTLFSRPDLQNVWKELNHNIKIAA